jgi:cbb3-type cytochrome oxidase subunit 3
MADQPAQLDAATRATLQQLADISVPPAVSFVPQTWGWVALAILLLVAIIAIAYVRHRRREANRYRREALAELDRLEFAMRDDAGREQAVLALPPLLKRVALAAWPREAVAPMTGARWVEFLQGHAGSRPFPDAAGRLFEDIEYRVGGSPVGAEEAELFARAARQWIEGHRVSA